MSATLFERYLLGLEKLKREYVKNAFSFPPTTAPKDAPVATARVSNSPDPQHMTEKYFKLLVKHKRVAQNNRDMNKAVLLRNATILRLTAENTLLRSMVKPEQVTVLGTEDTGFVTK